MAVADPSYDPIAITGFIYHWQHGRAINIYVHTVGEPDDADLQSAVRAATEAWKGVGRLGQIEFRIVDDLHDADVVFQHFGSPLLFTPTETCTPPALGSGGVTFFCVTDDGEVTPLQIPDGSGEFYMNVTVNRGAVESGSVFRSLVIHEMGHVLGIGAHSPDPDDLMNGRPRRMTPSEADEAALRYVLSRRADVTF
jgi:hypothetical protein